MPKVAVFAVLLPNFAVFRLLVVFHGFFFSRGLLIATYRDDEEEAKHPSANSSWRFGKLEDVVQTRVFIKNMLNWKAVARAHGLRFGDILPVSTLVQANLVGDENLVEIEAKAIIN